MSLHTRSLSSHIRASVNPGASVGPSPALAARIEEKKAELDSLKQLRDLSADVASQMEALEQKLTTLSGGTEGIATIVNNWHNVLRAISMASSNIAKPPQDTQETALPETLVRIPTEHAPTLVAQAEAAEEDEVET